MEQKTNQEPDGWCAFLDDRSNHDTYAPTEVACRKCLEAQLNESYEELQLKGWRVVPLRLTKLEEKEGES